MELKNWLVLIFAAFVFVFGVLKRLNGWYYEAKLGKLWPKLPPGDMGWPIIGSTLTYVKDYIAGQPQNFVETLKIRYISHHRFISKSLFFLTFNNKQVEDLDI